MAGVQLNHLMLHFISTKAQVYITNACGYIHQCSWIHQYSWIQRYFRNLPAVYPRLNYIDTPWKHICKENKRPFLYVRNDRVVHSDNEVLGFLNSRRLPELEFYVPRKSKSKENKRPLLIYVRNDRILQNEKFVSKRL